jgi:hypothetical protein
MQFAFEVGRGRSHRVDFTHHLFGLPFVSIKVDGVPTFFAYCAALERAKSYTVDVGRHIVQIEQNWRNPSWFTGYAFARMTYSVYVDGEFVWEYAS